MKAKWLKIRLFLEGIEVPIVSAVVTSVPDAPLSCTMQIPPLDEIRGLIERTLVHLFYYDPQPEDVSEWDSWHLLFVGEVTGYRIQKTPIQRAAVLQCMGPSNYWDVTYLFNNTGMGKTGRQLANFTGANTSVTTSNNTIFTKSSSGFSKIAKLINSRPSSFSQMKGLLGGIVHVLEQVGGFYRGTNSFKGFNEFTSIAELRLKLMQQIHAASNDSTSAKIVSRKRLRKWVKSSIASKGSMSSYNELIKKLMQLIYHDRQSIPAPPYFPAKETRKKKSYYVAKGVSSQKIVSEIKELNWKLDRHGLNPQNWKGILDMGVNGYSKLAKRCGELALQAKKKASSDQAPKYLGAAKWLNMAANNIRTNRGELASLAKTADASYMHDLLGKFNYFRAPLQYADKALSLITGLRRTTQKKSRTVVETEYERLGIHVFKPDIFFAPPPVCNVLFPELYHSFEFGRNYLAEPTRLMLRGGGGRSSSIFSGGFSKYAVYFAPDIPSVHRSIKLSSKKFVGEILPHEIYSGIIPTQVQIPWAKVYQISIKGQKKYPYIQRLANFEYFKRHFGSRSANVVGPFNPYFLPGFPTMILDRPMTNHDLEVYQSPLSLVKSGMILENNVDFRTKADLLDYLVPTQYVGQSAQVTHSISQSDGQTSYVLTMVREHRETGQKLGIDTKEVRTRYRSGTRSRLVLIPPGYDIKKIRYGPTGHKVLSAKRLSHKVLRIPGKSFFFPMSGAPEKKGNKMLGAWGRKKWSRSDVTTWELKKEYGQAREKAYRIVEQVGKSSSKKITKDVPLETSLTPPWLAQLWHMSSIGNTYQAMFGCQAISDEIGAVADSTLAVAGRRDASLGDTTAGSKDASPYSDDLPVPNKQTDTLDYAALDDDNPVEA